MSSPGSSSAQEKINQALGSLDLTLESELALFRRYRNSGQDLHGDSNLDVVTDRPSQAHPIETLADSTDDQGLLAPDFDREEDWSLDLPDLESSEREDKPPILGGALVLPSKALVPSDSLKTYTDPVLDDYLESSEELLKHLNTPMPKSSLEESSALKWFGWLAGLTLIVSLLAAFFLKNNIGSVRSDSEPNPVSNNQADNQADPLSPTQQSSTSTVTSTANGTPTPSIQGPNLAAKEFVDVNSSTLSQLTPAPRPQAPNAATSPPENRSSNLTANPSPNPTIDRPVTENGKQYYVVTDYQNAESLKTARVIVSTAEIVEFTGGTKIQLGQYSSIAAAQAAADELRQKGLKITILATAGAE